MRSSIQKQKDMKGELINNKIIQEYPVLLQWELHQYQFHSTIFNGLGFRSLSYTLDSQ